MATKGKRTFNGERYSLTVFFPKARGETKSDAMAAASRFRRGGYKARVVPHKAGHSLYTRKVR